MKKLFFVLLLISSLAISFYAQKIRTVSVTTEPDATVWIDDVKQGKTDATGKLTARFLFAGIHKIRVRAFGFKEISQNISPGQSQLRIALSKTTDSAELAFQEAEKISTTDRPKAIELYQKAIGLRAKYAEAYVGMARAMTDSGDTENALIAIANARKSRLIYPEASAIEGRIHKADGDEAKAIASFKRAIKEGNGFQPEAHTGLGLLYKEKAEEFSTTGDFENEAKTYEIAVGELKTALSQLAGAEPVLYELLGVTYEKMQKPAQAIAVYEGYLRIFPTSTEATTFRSYIVQLKKQMAQP
jgi:tetratricopeptide (TPR) repeat protein